MLLSWLRRRPHSARRVAPEAEWLEPRLLYSADLAATVLPAALESDSGETRALTATGEFASASNDAATAATTAALGLRFEVNQGQAESGVDFVAAGSGYAVALDGGSATLSLTGANGTQSVRLTLEGANPQASGEAEGLLASRSNVITGSDPSRWFTDIANYASVLYRDVYEGVDLRYHGNEQQLEYDFIAAPGADTSAIRLRFEGAQEVAIAGNGDLVVRIAGSEQELRFHAPVSYQRGPAGMETVSSAYVLNADGSVGFAIGPYDATRELVIDPVLHYATYLGNTGTDAAVGIATDSAGNVYVTGQTTGNASPFAGAVGGAGGGASDIFVAKLSPDLGTLLWSTRIGGSGAEQGNAIAVDANGNVAVTGWTTSSNFPTTTGADDASLSGAQDAVVFKLNASGSSLVFSTLFGGNGDTDSGNAVAFDSAGNVYAAGRATDSGLLPLVLQLLFGASDNAFVNKYGAAGNVVYQELIGGSSIDTATGIAVGSGGDVYVVGNTQSGNMATVNEEKVSLGGAIDGFLVRLGATGGTTLYATYIGGGDADTTTGVAIDGSGKAYVVGETRVKSNAGFILTSNALKTSTTVNNGDTGFLRVYDTTRSGGGSLLYSSYVGGDSANDRPTAVAYALGRVVIAGEAASTSGFPLSAGAVQATNAGQAMFVLVVNPAGNGAADLDYGTLYGSAVEVGAIATSGSHVYVAGGTGTASLGTSGAYQPARSSGTDGLVVAFDVLPNGAPVLNGAVQPAAVLEDSGAGSGYLVSALVAGQISDDFGAEKGIAITAADNANGVWEYSLDGSTWTATGTRSTASALLLAADAATRVRFVPTGNFAGTAGLTFRAWDRTSGSAGATVSTATNGGTSAFSAATATASLTVTAVNDQPTASASPTSVSANEGSTSLGLAGITYGPGGGVDEASQVLGATVTGLPPPAMGRIVLADGTTDVVAGNSYTLADLQGMRFVAATGVAATGTFTFNVVDGGGTANGGVNSLAQSVTINLANQAPVLTGANDPAAILEDDTANTGMLVADLLAGKATDAGGALGIAVTDESSPSGGRWQYSLDGGASWNNVSPSAADTKARLLAADSLTRVRYVPGTDWNGTATLTYRAWDRSSGTAGTRVDVSINGGNSAFSAATATASIVVTPVNDPPLRSAGSLAPRTVDEGSSGSLLLTGLNYAVGPASASDETSQSLTFTVTAVPGSAVGTVTLLDGTPVVVGGVYTLNQLRNFAFVAAPGANSGSGTLSWTVKDSGGTANGGAETLAQDLSITLKNLAPVLNGVNAMPTIAEDAASNNGMLVADLIAGQVTDAGSTPGVAVVAAGDPNGTWQYSRDNGGTWTTFSGVSNGAATLLAADGQNRIRFVPAADWNGTAGGLVLRAWDQSGGTAGATTGNTTSNGGTTAYSAVTRTVNISVTPVDDASVLLPDSAVVPEDSAANGNVLVNDGDIDSPLAIASFMVAGDATVYTAGQGAAIAGIGSINIAANGDYLFTPAANWNGNVPVVRYTTSTGASSTLAITVDPVNDAPAAVVIPSAGQEDAASIAVSLGGIDVDGSVASVTLQTLPANGVLFTDAALTTAAVAGTTYAPGTFYFKPAADFHGLVNFGFKVTDDLGAVSALQTATISVTAVDDATLAVADGQTVAEDAAAVGNVLTNDRDVDSSFTVATFTVAGDGTIYTAGQSAAIAGIGTIGIAANGDYVFTPAADWNGNVPVVTYTTSTGASATLTLRVSAVDDATVAAADGNTVAEDNSAAGNVLANDGDIDSALAVATFTVAGDPTLYAAGQVAAIAGVGSIGIAANGDYLFTPVADWNGSVPVVTYTTSTGAVSTLSLTIVSVNDAPSAGAATASGNEDAPGIAISLGGADVDGSIAGWTLQGLPAGGALYTDAARTTLAATGVLYTSGTFYFEPAADANGTTTFGYTVTDNDGASSAPALASITVLPVNDTPVRNAGTVADLGVVEGSPATSLGLASIGYSPGSGGDEAAQSLTYTVTAVPDATFGRIVLADGTTVVAAGSTYTLTQLRGMQFAVATGVNAGSGSFAFSVRDDGGGADTLAQGLAIRVVNQAPVLLGANSLPDLLEDATSNPGLLVSDLVAGQVSDPGGVHGIAVTAGASSAGEWQYSRDGGSTWGSLAGASTADATLLRADGQARIRFVPAADWNGAAGGLAFRAWDGSGGSAGQLRADAGSGGGSTAFSTATATLAVRVLPVNDAPILGSDGLVVQASEGGNAVALGLDAVRFAPGGGNDEAAQHLGVTILGLPATAAGRLVLADGTVVVEGAIYTVGQLQGMQFFAAPGSAGQVGDVTWILADDGGTDTGGVDRVQGSVRVVVAGGVGIDPLPAAPAPASPAAPAPAPQAAPGLLKDAPAASTDSPAPGQATAPRGGDRGTANDGLGLGTDLLGGRSFAGMDGAAGSFALERHFIPVDPLRPAMGTLLDRGAVQMVGFDTDGDFRVTGFSSQGGSAVRASVEELKISLRSGTLVEELNRLRRQLREDLDLDQSVVISVAGLSLGVSVLYVLWLVRGGVLLGSYLSALPAWRMLDPLPVLAQADGEEEEEDEDDALGGWVDAPADPLRGIA